MFPLMSINRYNRQLLLESFDEDAQRKLSESTIAIVGLGALGTHHAETLTRMGTGHLILIDRDFVELDNLNRQVLFNENDAAEKIPKAEAARARLGEINSEVESITHIDHLGPRNIKVLLEPADLIIDGTDNFITRYLLNDYSRSTGKPYIYCGVVGYQATCFIVLPERPCLRCLFRDMPDPSVEPACDTAGVWPPAVALISALAVDLSLRWITGNPPEDGWPMYYIDLSTGNFRRNALTGLRDDTCPACKRQYDFLDAEVTDPVHMCGTNAYQILGQGETVDYDAVKEKLKDVAKFSGGHYFLWIDLGDGIEISLFRDGRALIRGVDDSRRAQAVYDKYIGS